MTRPALLLALLASLVAASAAQAQVELLPNLQPRPPVDPHLIPGFPEGVLLRFGTLTWNNGFGPAEIRGGAADGETREVLQCVYTAEGRCNLYAAGHFTHHPEHGHIHLDDYALYSLEPLDPALPVERLSRKTSFCLIDGQKLDVHLPGAARSPVYTTCGDVMQGISVGWGDEYVAILPGQEIDVTGLPAGEYRLAIEVDPLNLLRELDDADNTSSARIYLDPATLTVEVLAEVDPGAPTEIAESFPRAMARGQTIEVIISGKGFDAGQRVRFAGPGGAPKVSEWILESTRRIRARVSAGSGGPARERTYDLKVGPAVLSDALTVTP